MTKRGRGLLATEIAERIGRPRQAVVALLDALRSEGLVVRRGGYWRLSASAERRFGPPLRELNRDEKDVA